MAGRRAPVTPAIRALRAAGVQYSEHVFDYDRYPGAAGAAEFLDVDPHLTVKTIVFTTDERSGAVVLMHGDLEVSTKSLARELGVKKVRPATQREADRLTGYRFGGTSPLGMRSDPPVYAERTITGPDRVYVNAGSRGFLIGLDPVVLIELTGAALADLATD
ncbi:MAG: YbaK/EbsC family protein [Acidimicrobiia bacterium]